MITINTFDKEDIKCVMMGSALSIRPTDGEWFNLTKKAATELKQDIEEYLNEIDNEEN